MKKILSFTAILAIVVMSCTKDDLVIPNNSSVQAKETSSQRAQITSDAPIVNNTIIAIAGTTVELYATPYNDGNSCKWMVNGRLATEVHGASMTMTSNLARTCGVQVTILDAADRASTSPVIKIKWVSQ